MVVLDTLCVAAAKGHKDIVQLLLDRGADVNKSVQGGLTPLHEAAQRGYEDAVKILLVAGAGPNKVDEA